MAHTEIFSSIVQNEIGNSVNFIEWILEVCNIWICFKGFPKKLVQVILSQL